MKSCLELPGLGALALHVLAVIPAVGFHVLLVVRGSALRALTLSIFGIVHILLVVTGTALPTRPGEELCIRTATCTKFRKQKQDAAVTTILNTPALSLPYLATSGYLTSTEIKCLELPLPCLGALTLGVLGIVHILLKAVLAS